MVLPIRNDTNRMGLISMSERDVKRIQVLAEVRSGQRTVVSAAAVLELGVRQTFRLLSRYEAGGAGALIHQARGRASNRQLSAGIREYAVELVRTKYADFGPTLATEIREVFSGGTTGPSTSRMAGASARCRAAPCPIHTAHPTRTPIPSTGTRPTAAVRYMAPQSSLDRLPARRKASALRAIVDRHTWDTRCP